MPPVSPAPRQSIRITEVAPRDGLQSEKTIVPTDAKVAFIDALSGCGFPEIEVSSFVSAKWVPQLADAPEVFARITRQPGTLYSALVPNEQGLDAALKHKVDKVSVFTAASETFSRKNTNATITQTLERFKPVIARARQAKLPVRAYISCAIACPFEGPTPPDRVKSVAQALLELGADEIDLGDTIGAARPADIAALYTGLQGLMSPDQTTLHLHDTKGHAIACARTAVELGVRSFDSSAGGLGGCPYAPGAPGNVATEKLVALFAEMGFHTGIDPTALSAAIKKLHPGSLTS